MISISLSSCGNLFPSASEDNSNTSSSETSTSDTRTLQEKLEDSVVTSSTSFANASKWTSLGYANDYNDSQSRTSNKESSGFKQNNTSYLARNNTANYKNEQGVYYRLSDSIYGNNGNSFRINMIDGSEGPAIYKGAVYTDMDDVAAYLYAFGELPVNMDYNSKTGKTSSVNDWGKYGRVNNAAYSNNSADFKYEPEAWTHSIYFDKPESSTDYWYYYVETDYGPQNYNQESYVTDPHIYNNGDSIVSRGVSRFIYTAAFTTSEHNDSDRGKPVTNVLERHVFYTYNHYNDFQEYLNYYGGWNTRYGNMTAGNGYNKAVSSNPPTTVEPFAWTTMDMLKK
jgi:uncharacterized membrane protein